MARQRNNPTMRGKWSAAGRVCVAKTSWPGSSCGGDPAAAESW